ncbi:MAG: hypothetical protein ACD_75C00373G0003 [uncultured bacterium]|nr:MAG: hypothetical protein ACD_75C00373G0003 [uncultured bacterium]
MQFFVEYTSGRSGNRPAFFNGKILQFTDDVKINEESQAEKRCGNDEGSFDDDAPPLEQLLVQHYVSSFSDCLYFLACLKVHGSAADRP